jgi:AmmeMemoRadiSam system protein B
MAIKRRRRPAVAGHFYPADKEELIKAIESSFLHPIGPGRLPEPSGVRRRLSIGYVVPHAGYMYSGPVAAHSYYSLAFEGPPETIIIIGPNHQGFGSLVATCGESVWETPLGLVEVDYDFVKELVGRSKYLDIDYRAHLFEHSVEVQIPFLQYIFDSKFKIVPIVLLHQTPEVSLDLANAIYETVKELGTDYVLLASSDFTHYEPHEVAVKKDSIALENIRRLDVDGLFASIEKYNITMCGPGAVGTLLYLGRKEGARGAEVLKYATSGDVTGDKAAVVGYAAVRVPAPEAGLK